MEHFNLCIIKPNDNAFSETFIQEHVNRLPGNKKVLYGGAFPVYDNEGKYLIRSKLGLLSYLIQKRIFRKKNIGVRNRALVNYLKKENIDVVFAEYGMVGAMVTKACKQAGVPLVIHFHGADVHHKPTVATYYDFYKEAFKYADRLVAVSGDMVDELVRLGAPAEKIVKASCGVDTENFPLVDVLHSEKRFLAVGRFVEKKSPSSVIKAFKIVHEKFPDAHLTMAGGGPLFDETKALVSELRLDNSVELPGVLNSNEIKRLISRARSFVQHSVTAANGDKEGTPVTILEAGASGLAIVSTLHAGIKEAVINGETGFLVPEHDIEGMAHYMIEIAGDADLASRMGIKESEYIYKNYNIKDRINTLAAILLQAIKRNKNDKRTGA
ncbi:MAG: glycosyltransferase [Bacteroidetes bacterium]|nr:glycosyltransferase [Bacteroidota bacterium]